MRRKVIMRFAIAGVALLLMGAAAVETVDKLVIEPRTVSSWGELVDCYLVARTTLPPLPFADADVFTKMKAGDWSFLADHWQYKQTGGSYYVSEKSALAKLKLPLHILVYEDLQRGEIVVLSSVDGKKYQGEALFKAPDFMPYEKDVSLDCYAFDELSPRRIIWEITLKPEADAWNDLVSKESVLVASALSLDGGEMMAMMSIPAEHTNDLWLVLETQTNGINLNIFAPEGFTNRVEIYSCTDLVAGIWEIAVQNLYPTATNPAVWDAGGYAVRFLTAGAMSLDSDGDGLPDAREKFVHKTDPNDADTDGDGMPDGWELQYGFNPLFYADGGFDLDGDGLTNLEEYQHGTNPTVADTDGDGLTDGLEVHTWGTDPTKTDTDDDQMPDYWEVTHGLNPLVNDAASDPDGDGVSNLAEYTAGTHPMIAAGSQGGLVYHYDEDGRLTDAQFNGNAAAWYGSSPVQNLTGINIYTGN